MVKEIFVDSNVNGQDISLGKVIIGNGAPKYIFPSYKEVGFFGKDKHLFMQSFQRTYDWANVHIVFLFHDGKALYQLTFNSLDLHDKDRYTSKDIFFVNPIKIKDE